MLNRLFNPRLLALIRKELGQFRRDRRLIASLLVPPIVQMTLFGTMLSPRVSNLRLGVVDESRSPESREFVAALSESKSFYLAGVYLSSDEMGAAIARDALDAGVVVPSDLADNLRRGRPTTVQFLLNAVNANTASIGMSYAQGVIETFNRDFRQHGIHALPATMGGNDGRIRVQLQPAYLYNPGLVSSWFVVTGILGMLLIMNGSLTASTIMVKEREAGTLEQLLMTPARTADIIIAKIAPLLALLSMMGCFAVFLMRVIFGVPFRGSVALVVAGAMLCILAGIGIGTSIATFSKSARQAFLTTFFVTPPLSSLSGAFMPVEAMPRWMQPLTILNPIYHFGRISRGALIRGSGLGTLWPNLLVLLVFALVLVSVSVWRFRKQLS